MRLLRFLKRLKRKYRQWRVFATRREAIRWAWLQSKNGKVDYDKIEIINVKEIADKIIKEL